MDVTGYTLVVGAGSGIGLETALTFAERGARGVAFADKNLENAHKAAERSKSIATAKDYNPIAIAVDVTDRTSVRNMVAEVSKIFGRIDYAINSAGVPRLREASVPEVDEVEFDRLQDVNCKGILHCLQEEILAMGKQEHAYAEGRGGKRSIGPGSIICITSLAALVGSPKSVTYSASKFAARAVVKCAAIENRKSGLRINEVCPGFTDTPMLHAGFVRDPNIRNLIEKAMPLGRCAAAEEVAGVVHFLASPSASFVNGQSIVVDSGVSVSVVT